MRLGYFNSWRHRTVGVDPLGSMPMSVPEAVSYTHLDVYKRQGVNAQSLVAAVARFRFQAGEAAFLFSFLTFLLLGHGSSFLCRAFAFRLNRRL